MCVMIFHRCLPDGKINYVSLFSEVYRGPHETGVAAVYFFSSSSSSSSSATGGKFSVERAHTSLSLPLSLLF